ncbi:hypothetical protein D3C77_571620 [compost metagenome]
MASSTNRSGPFSWLRRPTKPISGDGGARGGRLAPGACAVGSPLGSTCSLCLATPACLCRRAMLSATQATARTCGVRQICRLTQVYKRCLRLLGVNPCWVVISGRPKRRAASQPKTRPLKPCPLISNGPFAAWRDRQRLRRSGQRRSCTPASRKRRARASGPPSSSTLCWPGVCRQWSRSILSSP